MSIQWETARYGVGSSAQFADVVSNTLSNGRIVIHRFFVKRTRKGSRHFTGYIDGQRVQGSCLETMDLCKISVIAEARRRGIMV